MTIHVLERSNPDFRPEPEVFVDGREAVKTMRKEYTQTMEELGIMQGDESSYECYSSLEGGHCGECSIADRDSSDRWEWRITEHILADEESCPEYLAETAIVLLVLILLLLIFREQAVEFVRGLIS